MTWHLFRLEVQTNPDPLDSTVKAFIASAESDSQLKAEELARAAVLDSLPDVPDEECPHEGLEWDPPAVDGCWYLGVIDRDVFIDLGVLA